MFPFVFKLDIYNGQGKGVDGIVASWNLNFNPVEAPLHFVYDCYLQNSTEYSDKIIILLIPSHCGFNMLHHESWLKPLAESGALGVILSAEGFPSTRLACDPIQGCYKDYQVQCKNYECLNYECSEYFCFQEGCTVEGSNSAIGEPSPNYPQDAIPPNYCVVVDEHPSDSQPPFKFAFSINETLSGLFPGFFCVNGQERCSEFKCLENYCLGEGCNPNAGNPKIGIQNQYQGGCRSKPPYYYDSNRGLDYGHECNALLDGKPAIWNDCFDEAYESESGFPCDQYGCDKFKCVQAACKTYNCTDFDCKLFDCTTFKCKDGDPFDVKKQYTCVEPSLARNGVCDNVNQVIGCYDGGDCKYISFYLNLYAKYHMISR